MRTVTTVLATAVATTVLTGSGTASAATQPLKPWWFTGMQLDQAHRLSTGKGVVVAVVDDSLDSSVPELRGADIRFGHTCAAGYEQRAKPFVGPASDHGTAMTSLIVGQGRGDTASGQGIQGVAPDAQVRFYPVDSDPRHTSAVTCDELEIGKQVVDAARGGADIISISLGMGSTITPYIRRAMSLGAVVVASAGDRRSGFGGHMDYPADVPGVVGVNAVDFRGRPWRYNPTPNLVGRQLWFPVISAPGVKVTSGGYVRSLHRWVSGGHRTGTSDATAIVAGALALVKSRFPRATGNQLIQQLIHHSAGSRVYAWDRFYGFGILSPAEMLRSDPTGWPDVNPLLKGPTAALAAFPMSSRTAASPSPAGSGVTPSGQASTSPSAGPSTSPATSPSAGPATSSASHAASGPASWVWAAVGVVLAAAVAATLAIRRRGRRTVATGNSKEV